MRALLFAALLGSRFFAGFVIGQTAEENGMVGGWTKKLAQIEYRRMLGHETPLKKYPAAFKRLGVMAVRNVLWAIWPRSGRSWRPAWRYNRQAVGGVRSEQAEFPVPLLLLLLHDPVTILRQCLSFPGLHR